MTLTAKEREVLEYWLLDSLLLKGDDEEQADQVLYNLRRLTGELYTDELASWLPNYQRELRNYHEGLNCT